jgi:hypothetical protein
VENGYREVPFPFQIMPVPDFISRKAFTLTEFFTYLNIWSATQNFIIKHGFNPTEKVFNDLSQIWGDPKLKRHVTWKLLMKVGKVQTKR